MTMYRSPRLLAALLDRVRQYEVEIAKTVGVVAHRQPTLCSWDRHSERVVQAEMMPRAWRMLGLAVADRPERFIAAQS
jgi:hypothetical protein